VKVTIFVEGGGDSKEQIVRCREGFRKLVEKAGFTRPKSPAITACGGRGRAYDKFKTVVAISDSGYAILLVDSEDPVNNADEDPDSGAAWQHLRSRDGWERPASAENDQAQLMATCMETWLMADQQALRAFFGHLLHSNALLSLHNLEARTRHEVQEALQRATRDCGKDRTDAKGEKSFKVLAELDPTTLKRHLLHFRRFIATLDLHL
jgi:Domain of unknown function (DUF4276)